MIMELGSINSHYIMGAKLMSMEFLTDHQI